MSLSRKLVKIANGYRHRFSALQNFLPTRRIGIGRNVKVCRRVLRPPYFLTLLVQDNCNLTCRNCNMGAPDMPEASVEPATLFRSLERLKRHYRPRTVYVQGGEALLHPDLDEILRVAKHSGIAPHVTLLTNGTLLHKISDRGWRNIDALEISAYPGSGVDTAQVAAIRRQASRLGVKVTAYRYDNFRVSLVSRPTGDENLVNRIYRACEVAHLWGCHTLYGDRFFKCSQAIFAPRIAGSNASYSADEDGILLDNSPHLFEKLYAYLDSREPLKGCAYCLASAGLASPHKLLKKGETFVTPAASGNELIDQDKLVQLESGFGRYVETRTVIDGEG